tara:strand:+ start:379 stop:618 length:240 start_codon:yes stop_codon:yes gene_type:complete
MCIICTGIDNNSLSPWEARRNLGEMTEKIGHEHARKVQSKISNLIFEEINLNYGETIEQPVGFCDFCDDIGCLCAWGSD